MRKFPRRPLRLLLALFLLLALACNFPYRPYLNPTPTAPALLADTPTANPLPTGTPQPTASATPTPAPAYTPGFEPAACPFDPPPGTDPTCGYLVVPEDRTRADGPQIRLAVAVFHSSAADPAPDPVVYLSGGPGSSALDLAGYMFQQGIGGVLGERDLIFFDQRGTGYSQPRLDCPERDAITAQLLGGGLSPDEKDNLIEDAFRRCKQRLLGQGSDLAAYNSAASAADVQDLRRALGYDQVDLYGDSYGTRLALTVLRDRPEGIRSVVLDSVYPLEVNLYTSLAPNAERAFDAFFAHCAADPSCAAAYPDLENVFYGLVDAFNAHPLSVSLGAGSPQVSLDGGLLVDVLFSGLYNAQVIASMPQMIYDVRDGNYDILRNRLWLYFEPSTALGMEMSVQCSEEIPFSPLQEAFDLAQGVRPEIAGYYPASVRSLFAACADWDPNPPDPRENQPVASDVPALVLAGSLDPITPPAWGRQVAANLSHSYFYEFPGQGHWVTRSSYCALAMALSFWEDPTRDPGSACS